VLGPCPTGEPRTTAVTSGHWTLPESAGRSAYSPLTLDEGDGRSGVRAGLADYHADMRKLDRRMATIAEAYPLPYAVAVGLVAGALAFLIGWIARREWIWFLFVMAAVVAGASTYTGTRWRRQDRKRRERHRQHPG
jgi:hypothetical protein